MLIGNLICIVISVIETVAFNGFWIAWGQITAIFKEKDMFLSY